MSELIERLRLAAEDTAGGPPSVEQVEALIAYADALEAELAARQPSGDDREAAMSAASDALLRSGTDHWPDIQAQIVDAVMAVRANLEAGRPALENLT